MLPWPSTSTIPRRISAITRSPSRLINATVLRQSWIFQEQAQAFDDSKLIKCLQPVVSCLYTLSSNHALNAAVSLVGPFRFLFFLHLFLTSLSCRCSPLHLQFFPESVSFYPSVSFHTLLTGSSDIWDYKTAKSVKGSYNALVEIFECIEGLVRRLMIYTKIEQPTPAMTEVLIKIMAELISVLARATKQVNQGRLSKYLLSRA